MKKIYSLLVMVMIVSVGYAQISTQTIKKENLNLQKQEVNYRPDRSGAGSWWFSYCEDLMYYMGTELDYGYVNFLQDSVGTIQYSDGDGRPQFFSFAQVFNFEEQIWHDLYFGLCDEDGTPIPVPYIGGTNTYSIDSMSCIYAYLWGENVPTTTVDTLVMTIIADDNLEYMTLNAGGTPAFIQAEIDYDFSNSSIAQATHPKFYTVKVPLTIDDTTGGYFVYKNLPVVGFNNLNTKTVAVAYSFISGKANRVITDVIGTDINRFVAYYNEDPRDDYSTFGSTALMTEESNSMCAMDWTYTSSTFLGQYVSNSIWIGKLKRPGISVLASCDDCEWVGVEEIDQKNISVYPNPATNNFTVNLPTASTANVELFNIVGQKVYNDVVNELTVHVNVSELKPGIYMLKVTQDNKTYTTKVVVK
ncbi:MAG TPA: T9SS type A sorting domain-containing protein [Bacteroidales bacterium]|nr:T9SS type A sorting domain-containing protein [Bacteroidales bacterium]HOH22081.1 T9SS type A sorting domain-containing protein [Bacteroidales bacterium]HPZ03458.1 T9SS type A sorting domain-containing protein [Bacteroidales bacterium]HQB74763.1 T9SS type A sorting domain-containing protein [Bacteroidales bacterium]HQQ20817.1 T9SS type A sorting domain-containing protein [Bacteroidales bacterium]